MRGGAESVPLTLPPISGAKGFECIIHAFLISVTFLLTFNVTLPCYSCEIQGVSGFDPQLPGPCMQASGNSNSYPCVSVDPGYG